MASMVKCRGADGVLCGLVLCSEERTDDQENFEPE